MLAAIGGAYLSIGFVGSFSENLTAGRGFIALAAVIFGRWTPVGALLGALLFGFFTGVDVMINTIRPPGDLGNVLRSVPSEFYASLPYLVTIVVLAGVVGRSIPPAADGIPYEKEARA
jgi:simple sugar transport system permease protein